MKIFNLENGKEVEAKKAECIIIATWEEWKVIMDSVDEHAKKHPRSKRISKVREDLEHLAVW